MGSAQGRITIRRRPKDGENGNDGKPGDDAVVYEIVTAVDTLRITDEDVAMSVRITSGSTVTVVDNYTAVTVYGLSFTAKLNGKDATRYIDATEDDSQIYWGGSETLTKSSVLYLYLWKGGVCVAEKTLRVVADGDKGEQGIQGIQGCILRTTEWVSGTEYRNDEALTSGTRFIDIVIVKDGNTGEISAAYKCKVTHTATDSNKPGNTTYWDKFNKLAPIYTPMIFADKALLRLSQTNQLLVADDDGNVIGVFGGGTYPLQVGDNFKVDQSGKAYMTGAEISGKVTAGDADGQRVEIQPDNKVMAVYDEDGERVVSYEGNTITELSKLFGSSSGSFVVKSRTTTDAGFQSGVTYGKGKITAVGSDTLTDAERCEIIITSAVYSAVPVEVLVSGAIHSDYSIPEIEASTAAGDIYTPEFVSSASASIVLRVDTYSDSALTMLVGSTVVWRCGGSNETKVLSNTKAKTAVGGYHVLKIVAVLSATGDGAEAVVSWGASVGGSYSNLSATYTTESKVARYFANGFCLGNSDADYLWAYNQGANGMRVVMENNGYGVDVSQNGIKLKHHGGAWMNVPLLVFNGRVTYNSSSKAYSVSSAYSKSFDGNTPTATRSAEGKARLTFPSAWTSALSPSASNLIINVSGLGYISGSTSNLIKANVLSITSTYIDIGLSDDQSANDGDFIINISII